MKHLLWCFLLFGAACSPGKIPANIIPPEKMKTIVFDLLKADTYVNNFVLKDTTLKSKEQHIKMYEQVFLIHKITKKDFYISLNYYQQHPDVNKKLFDSTLSYANRQREMIFKEKYTSKPDSIQKK